MVDTATTAVHIAMEHLHITGARHRVYLMFCSCQRVTDMSSFNVDMGILAHMSIGTAAEDRAMDIGIVALNDDHRAVDECHLGVFTGFGCCHTTTGAIDLSFVDTAITHTTGTDGHECTMVNRSQGTATVDIVTDTSAIHQHTSMTIDASRCFAVLSRSVKVDASTTTIDIAMKDGHAATVSRLCVLGSRQGPTHNGVALTHSGRGITLSHFDKCGVAHVSILTTAEDRTAHIAHTVNHHMSTVGKGKRFIGSSRCTPAGAEDMTVAVSITANFTTVNIHLGETVGVACNSFSAQSMRTHRRHGTAAVDIMPYCSATYSDLGVAFNPSRMFIDTGADASSTTIHVALVDWSTAGTLSGSKRIADGAATDNHIGIVLHVTILTATED